MTDATDEDEYVERERCPNCSWPMCNCECGDSDKVQYDRATHPGPCPLCGEDEPPGCIHQHIPIA